MAIKVGINGFGRIGRMVARIIANTDGVELVHINDLTDTKTLAHLFVNDSVHGKFAGEVEATDKGIKINGKLVTVSAERDILNLPWKEKKVDMVVESTGVFLKADEVRRHCEAGAKKVILSVPSKDEMDSTIVLGVNNDDLKDSHKLLSNASCTTNCLSPMAMVLDREFGIKKSIMTTIHSYTADQNLVDSAHKDLRRARAAALNIIPTTTGAAKTTGKILKNLDKKIDGLAIRVPTANGSLTDFTVLLNKKTTPEEINAAYKKAGDTYLKGILKYSEEPLVSSDIIGDSHSVIIDGLSTMVVDGDLVKVLGWYDNEWGYSSRLVELIKLCK